MAKGDRTPAQLAHDAELSAIMKAHHAAKKASSSTSVGQKHAQKGKTYTAAEKAAYYAKKNGTEEFEKPSSVAAAYSSGVSARKPRFIAQTGESVIVVHRELVASVVGTSAFTATKFALNPGISATFPWLSSVAQAWEQYRFKKLKFEYYTRTGSNVPGSMMLVPDFDAADAAPDTEQIAMSYQDAMEDAPWKNICSNMAARDLHPNGIRKFVRTGNLASNLDIKTYDAGNMFLCTTDGSAVNWGKVYAEYECELFVPQLQPTGVAASTISAASWQNGGSVSSANPLGTAPTPNAGTTPQNISVDGASVLTFSYPGTYQVYFSATGTGMSGSLLLTGGLGVTTQALQQHQLASGLQEFDLWEVITTNEASTVAVTSTSATTTASYISIATALPQTIYNP